MIPIEGMALDIGLVDAGIGAAGALVGFAAQAPRLAAMKEEKERLEREVESMKRSLDASSREMATKINDLENQLFEMDREFEGATVRMKKDFDMNLREELASLSSSLKEENERHQQRLRESFDAELELELAKQNADLTNNFLAEKFKYVHGGNKEELEVYAVARDRAEKANAELQLALDASAAELKKMREATSKSAPWWRFGN